MVDNKQGRDAQADDADRRQRERAIAEELERGDEPEPPVPTAELAALEADLDAVTFPATGTEVVSAVGDREVGAVDDTYAIADVVPDATAETFEDSADVRARVQQPTVAAEMKRVVEASETLPDAELRGSQRDAYVKTFRELAAVDELDDDAVLGALGDWIVERIREKEALPGSRTVRKRAAKIARAEGYEVRNDEWLGA